jgi:HAD superfamily hydrolase (TIGR01459 family)
MSPDLPAFIDHFSALAPRYDVLLCDVWGVVHNGVASFPDACDALRRFREAGGTVVLITNAPRPGEVVVHLLDRLAVPRSAYDAIVSSGDVTRTLMLQRAGSVFHLGPDRDLPVYADLGIRLAPVDSADYVVCTGLFDDEVETADDYRDLLDRMRARHLPMICANPDIVVERGDRLLYCAGAIADRYAAMGGEVVYAGKPHAPIYAEALNRANAVRPTPAPLQRVLAIGDSVRTDLHGAAGYGIDFLFVTAGIHAEEFGDREAPDRAAVGAALAQAKRAPRAVMRRLAW